MLGRMGTIDRTSWIYKILSPNHGICVQMSKMSMKMMVKFTVWRRKNTLHGLIASRKHQILQWRIYIVVEQKKKEDILKRKEKPIWICKHFYLTKGSWEHKKLCIILHSSFPPFHPFHFGFEISKISLAKYHYPFL